MILIDGKKIAAELREELKKEVLSLKAKHNKIPGLTVILIGDMAPSQIYVRMKEKAANEVGLKSEVIRYPNSVEEKTVLDKIYELNKDNSVSGILVQLPLPKHIDKQKVIEAILPSKDVDGFHPMNVGNLSSGYESSVPCTPLGCYLLIKDTQIICSYNFILEVGTESILKELNIFLKKYKLKLKDIKGFILFIKEASLTQVKVIITIINTLAWNFNIPVQGKFYFQEDRQFFSINQMTLYLSHKHLR